MRKSIDYIRQLSTQSGLIKYFKKVQQQYKNQLNLAIYMNLQKVEKLKIFEIINQNDKNNFIVHFYGFRLPQNQINQQLEKLFIRQMDTIFRNYPKKKYSILLFHSSNQNKNCFQILKVIYKKVTAKYYVKLNKIYIIQPGFLIKSWGYMTFTSWAKLFNKYIQHVQRVQQIQQISQLKIYNVLCKCPKQITRDIKITNQTPNPHQKKLEKVQGPKPFDCLKRQFYQYPYDQIRKVPLILSIFIETMKNSHQSLLIQGIFRNAGSIQDQEQLLKYAFNLKTFRSLDSPQYCKKAIAGIIKKIFTLSTTPLISYKIYDQILNEKNIDQSTLTIYWKNILSQLPQQNRNILCYVVEFLIDFIIKNKQSNKMNAHNISVVFTPCFFRAKQTCLSDLIYSGKFAALFKYLLQKYDQIVVRKKNNLNYQSQYGNQINQTSGIQNNCCFLSNQYKTSSNNNNMKGFDQMQRQNNQFEEQ